MIPFKSVSDATGVHLRCIVMLCINAWICFRSSLVSQILTRDDASFDNQRDIYDLQETRERDRDSAMRHLIINVVYTDLQETTRNKSRH